MGLDLREKADSVIRRITEVLAMFSAIALLVIMSAMIFDVVVRTITGASAHGVYELVETLLIVAAFLALAYSERSGGNVRVTVFLKMFPSRVSAVLNRFGNLIAVVILVWLVWATSIEAFESFMARESSYGLVTFPLWPSRIVISLGSFVLLLEMIATLIRPSSVPPVAPMPEAVEGAATNHSPFKEHAQ